ncbi:UbiA prenyltransferase, partial [Candidatus Magnetoovum chiemensis]
IQDRHRDMVHPQKKLRAIASGQVSISNAVVAAVLLLIIAVLICHFMF